MIPKTGMIVSGHKWKNSDGKYDLTVQIIYQEQFSKNKEDSSVSTDADRRAFLDVFFLSYFDTI